MTPWQNSHVGSPRWLRSWNRAATSDHVATDSFLAGRIIEVSLKGGVKAVDHIAEADGQADVDDLLVREVLDEGAIGLVVNRLQAGRFLSIPDDCCL